MKVVENIPVWLVVLLICLVLSFVTEVTSNTVVTAITQPILAELVSINMPEL